MLEDKSYHILLIEDSEDDIRAVKRYCSKTTYVKTHITVLHSIAEFEQYLHESPLLVDLILLDLHLPDSSGIETFFTVRKMLSNVPVVITTAYEDYQLAVKAVKKGAQDYIEKDRFDEYLLGRTIRHSIEREKIETGLRSSLKQRQMLLKEVFHRVKNNLQIVSSLLSLQILHCQTEEAKPILEDVQNRIFSMSAVHEMLYGSDTIDLINCAEYFKKLCEHITHALTDPVKNIQLKFQASGISMPMDYAIPCGLIVTELVSNAFKHAFHQQTEGLISISLQKETEGFVLKVDDTGCGIPSDFNPENTLSMGFKVILSQVAQINGKFSLSGSSEGSHFAVEFDLSG